MKESEFITHWCPMCDGVSHPATGCVYTPTFIVCGPCTREFAKWIQQFTKNKGRGKGRIPFYDHVGIVKTQQSDGIIKK